MIFQGKEWDAEPVMIRDHSHCYTTPPIPIPLGDLEPEQWLREAMMRVIQEVMAAKTSGFERQDWADVACHMATVFDGAKSILTGIASILDPLDALRLKGEIAMVSGGMPATIISRMCDVPGCHGDDEHRQYALLLGADGEPDSNFFPPEWLIDGTPE